MPRRSARRMALSASRKRLKLRVIVASLAAVFAVCVVPCVSAKGASDSLRHIEGTRYHLVPERFIVEPAINECSGIAKLGDAWYTHNDSGGTPTLYRASSLDFTKAETLPVPGAKARDWEAITVMASDLMVCDIGDNARVRDDCVIYRVRPTKSKDKPLELIGHYPIRYPDGKHDAEAVFVHQGAFHIIVKNRGEPTTDVFRFSKLLDAKELGKGKANVGVKVASLTMPKGEQITAATLCHASASLIVLTYSELLVWTKGVFSGKPTKRTRIHARQCEALCLDGTTLWFANEQRDVFKINKYLARDISEALPPRPTVLVPLNRTAPDAQPTTWRSVSLRNATGGESLRIAATPTHIHIRGSLAMPALEKTTPGQARVGAGIWLGFSGDADQMLGTAQRVVAIGIDKDNKPVAQWMPWGTEAAPSAIEDVDVQASYARASFTFAIALPRAELGTPTRFNAIEWNGRPSPTPRIVSGFDVYTFLRPYMWAPIAWTATRETVPATDE